MLVPRRHPQNQMTGCQDLSVNPSIIWYFQDFQKDSCWQKQNWLVLFMFLLTKHIILATRGCYNNRIGLILRWNYTSNLYWLSWCVSLFYSISGTWRHEGWDYVSDGFRSKKLCQNGGISRVMSWIGFWMSTAPYGRGMIFIVNTTVNKKRKHMSWEMIYLVSTTL